MNMIGVKPEQKESSIGERRGSQRSTSGVNTMRPMKWGKLQAVPAAVL